MDSMQRLLDARALARLATRDATLFSDDPKVQALVAHRLGWTTLAADAPALFPTLDVLAEAWVEREIEHVGLLGMGGSSLAALVMARIIGSAPGYPRLHVLDTTSPRTIMDVQNEVDMARAGWLVSSKSGGTIEPNALYAILREEADAALGRDEAGAHFIAVTDPDSSLAELAEEDGFAATVLAPPTVGGRYSALSAFGLVPAALIGIDAQLLTTRALEVESAAGSMPPTQHPAMQLAAFLGDALADGRDKLTIVTPPDLRSFGLWVEQLVAESLGKHGLGIVPVIELAEDPDIASYGDDRAVAVVCLAECERFVEGVRSRADGRIPVHVTSLADPYDLGKAFVIWEWAVALSGFLLGINPFDEPDVAAAKSATLAALEGELVLDAGAEIAFDEGAVAFPGGVPDPAPATLDDALASALGWLGDGDYLGVLAYLPDAPDLLAPLAEVAGPLSSQLGKPVCVELGPRYLHSTGQLHKGGPNSGVFIVVVGQGTTDIPVPGEHWTLADLNRAQSLGDLLTLEARDRRVIRVMLPDESAEAVGVFAAALARAARR